MTEQELIESRKNIPAWKQSKKIHPEDYQKLEQKRFDMELENINKSYNKESYYDGLL